MSDSLDLSKIVNLIMENPTLINEISALAQGEKKQSAEEKEPEPTPIPEGEVTASVPENRSVSRHERRTDLLNAMKPYLSDERSKTIDTMLSIVGVLGAMRGR